MALTMGAPLLDGCVLALLNQEDLYGYALTQRVKAVLDISESTLYPVLRRLQKDGCLSVYDQPYQGRNRRYYAITRRGKERLGQIRGEWRQLRDSLDRLLLKEGTGDE